jgi:hypothetical protein
MASNSDLEGLLLKSIEAQNRTTRAVRSLVYFILIQVVYSIPGALFLLLGSNQGSDGTGLIFIGALVLLVGGIHALYRGFSEAKASELSASVSMSPQTGTKNLLGQEFSTYERELTFALNRGEFKAWVDAGKPSLVPWDEAGRPDLIAWLKTLQ